MYNKATNN